MQQRKYSLLLHDRVRSHIGSLDSRQRERLREKLDYLRHGMWDAGVLVKKLKGGRSVFEARLTKGDRILFTLGHAGADDAPRGVDATRIYVWGVVKHDDVNAAGRRIVAANAPFLDFRPDEVEDFPELVLDDLSDDRLGAPDHARVVGGGYPAGGADEAGPQRWLMVDDQEWRRLLETEDPDGIRMYLFLTGEQARLLHSEPPVLLSGTAGSGKTTLAVYYLLRRRARQLAGSAAESADAPGDAAAADSERALFVTGSPYLKRFSEGIYRGLVAGTDLEDVPDAAHFATFAELLGQILPADRRAAAQRPTGLREFHAIFHNYRNAVRYDAELVWEEIRSIIKGAKPPVSRRRFAELAGRYERAQATMRERAELAEYLVRLGNLEVGDRLDAVRERKTSFASLQEFAAAMRDAGASRHAEQMFVLDAALRVLDRQAARLEQPLLTLREYESLGRKRAPNFPFDRRDIYRIAEHYQEHLERTSRVDEIDLTRAALQHLERHDDRFRYDLVVCDEVQDFTDMQLALLFRLAADPLRTVLAGDPRQIINPSGFRWAEVRARYYERGLRVPEVVNLSVNFRSVGNIVALANELLRLKRSLAGRAAGEIAERWTFRGRPPLLLDGLAEPELLRAMRQAGAGQVVLVRTPAERDRLRAALASELVFTINDAKGLEFDGVLLWRFAETSGSEKRWWHIAREHHLKASETPRIRHEINLLYVAVTRARNTLVIWDGPDAGPVWSVDQLAGHVLRSGDAEALRTIWQRVSSAAEWKAQGDYFFDREHFAAAEECYRNAGAHTRQALSRAHHLERSGDHRAAADLFADHGKPARAAENLELGNAWREAARVWRRAGDDRRALRCDALHFEGAGRYVKAAARWRQLGDTARMVGNWERAGEHRLLADHYLSLGRSGKAAHHLRLLGDHARAALQYRRAGMIDYAAQAFEKDRQYDEAAPLYRRLGDTQALLRCLLALEDYHQAACMYEKQDDLDQAIDCFRRYADRSDGNRRDLERRLAEIGAARPGVGEAVRLAGLGRHLEAARIFERQDGCLPQAIGFYQEAGDHAAAAACLASGNHYREAAREVALTGARESLAQAVAYLRDYVLLATWERRRDRIDRLTRAARRLSAGGEHERALAHLLAVQQVQGDRVAATVVEDACREYARLERHEEALGYFLDETRSGHAFDYLSARPTLALPIAAVERMARGAPPGEVTMWTLPDDRLEVMLLLLYRCLRFGREADRRTRVADILATLPKHYAVTFPIFEELGEMLVDLRLINPIVSLLSVGGDSADDDDDGYPSFVDRVLDAARRTGDREMQLSLMIAEPELLDEELAGLRPTERNYLLFAHSPTRYPEAVAVLRRLGDDEEAVNVCRRYGDEARAERILQAEARQQSFDFTGDRRPPPS